MPAKSSSSVTIHKDTGDGHVIRLTIRPQDASPETWTMTLVEAARLQLQLYGAIAKAQARKR